MLAPDSIPSLANELPLSLPYTSQPCILNHDASHAHTTCVWSSSTVVFGGTSVQTRCHCTSRLSVPFVVGGGAAICFCFLRFSISSFFRNSSVRSSCVWLHV